LNSSVLPSGRLSRSSRSMLLGTILGSSQTCHRSEFSAECGAWVVSPTLPLSGRQGARGGKAKTARQPVHSRGLLEGSIGRPGHKKSLKGEQMNIHFLQKKDMNMQPEHKNQVRERIQHG
jgi:hypothetical protein